VVASVEVAVLLDGGCRGFDDDVRVVVLMLPQVSVAT
jgi:hypothetical protein